MTAGELIKQLKRLDKDAIVMICGGPQVVDAEYVVTDEDKQLQGNLLWGLSSSGGGAKLIIVGSYN